MGHIVGIDLGTTNSCVAYIDNGRPRVIEDDRGYNILPSCVAIKSKGRFTVGHGAKSLILTKPGHAVYGVKRLMGRKFRSPEVQEVKERVGYTILQGEEGDVLIQLADLEVTPVEVAAIILKAIKDIAEKHLGGEVTDAVITVPAHFNHRQRESTLEAGKAAGLNVLRLLSEPTAAALAYGHKRELDKRIVVYDLGGGTFDVTVIEISGGVYEVLATNGDTYLGGEDFDYRIVDLLADQFHAHHGIDLREDPIAMQRLKDAAERAKCELSFVDKTPILIPRIHGTHNLEATLNREDLENLVKDLIDQTIKVTHGTLEEAGLVVDDLDAIILVGGMTRMPKIQESIQVFFGMKPSRGVHPEEVVAVGAAVHGNSLGDESEGGLLLDVTPHTLGIDTAGGFFVKVIEKNATVPVTQSRLFTTVVDNQEEVRVTARQGESTIATENEFLGQFILGGIQPAPRMSPRIMVSFRIDANGILHVAAVDQETKERKTIDIRNYVEGGESEPVALIGDDDSVQMVGDLSEGGAPEQKKGFFSRLAGLFGGKKKAATAEMEGEEAPEDGTDLTRREHEEGTDLTSRTGDSLAPPSEGYDPGTDLESRGDAPPAPWGDAPGTDLQSRGGAPAHPWDEQPGTDVAPRGGIGGTDVAPRGGFGGTDVAPRAASGTGVAPRGGYGGTDVAPRGAGSPGTGIAPRGGLPPLGGHDDEDEGTAVYQRPPGGSPFGSGPDSHGIAPRESTGLAPRESTGLAPRESTGLAPRESTGLDPRNPPAHFSNRMDLPGPDAHGLAPRADLSAAPGDDFGVAPRNDDEDSTAVYRREVHGLAPRSGASAEIPVSPHSGAPRPSVSPEIAADLRASLFPEVVDNSARTVAEDMDPFMNDNTDTYSGPFPGDGPRVTSDPSGFAGRSPEPAPVGELDLDDLQDDDLSNVLEAALAAVERPSAHPDMEQPSSIDLGTDMPTEVPGRESARPRKKRRPARLRIRYKRASTFLSEYRENLDRGGTFIKTSKPLPVGRDCIFEITVPGVDDPLSIRGSVVWSSRGVTELEPGQDAGMGVEYDLADGDGRNSIESAIAALS